MSPISWHNGKKQQFEKLHLYAAFFKQISGFVLFSNIGNLFYLQKAVSRRESFMKRESEMETLQSS
jgi:hypothetical protein